MSEPIAYGIDFGTTNSSIAIAYPDRTEVVSVDPQSSTPECLRSIVYVHRDGDMKAGQAAVEQYFVTGAHRTSCSKCSLVEHVNGTHYTDCKQHRLRGGCHDARLISGIKSELSHPHIGSTHSWARDMSMSVLVSVILRHLKQAADNQCGRSIDRVVLGHPVVFAGAEGPDFDRLQEIALGKLRHAAALAGFSEVIPLEEPVAAVMDETINQQIALEVDFGGGTFDAAMIRFSEDGGDVTGLKGVDIGGEHFDEALFSAKVAPLLGLDEHYRGHDGKSKTLPHWFKNKVKSLSGFKHLMADTHVPGIFSEFLSYPGAEKLAQVRTILYGGFAYDFYGAIERAKVDLSAEMKANISFRRASIEFDQEVDRAEFTALISPDLDRVEGKIWDCLAQACLEPDEVDVVLRTGGSSNIPAFVERLEKIFGQQKLKEQEAFTTVVQGLASYAREEWGNV